MEAEAKVGMDVIEQLIRLQEIDRKRDRFQKRLDQVPVKLKQHTDLIAGLESSRAEQEQVLRVARAEADRAELEVKSFEERREKIKGQMNAPKLTNREYEALQVELAGVLADINSHSDKAIKALERASEAETAMAKLEEDLRGARAAYEAARTELEGSLADVRQELDKRDAERAEFVAQVQAEPLQIYDRVRSKHKDALAIVQGTIDRAAGRIGGDLHCASCYMAITANDAVQVLARKKIVQCKSCVRILYVP